MSRDIPIGNGNLLVAFDRSYLLREFCFPHVGEENHTQGEAFRFGIWINGVFDWFPNNWDVKIDYLEDTLVTYVTLINNKLGIKIIANDLVDFHENIYLKKIVIENLTSETKEIRLFFVQNFNILGNNTGDTAAFRPELDCLLHYKNDRYFLINTYANKKFGIDNFATGNKAALNKEGTWKDAEDGILSNNPIAQGSVDSVCGMYFLLDPKQQETAYYWICAGKNWQEVSTLNTVIKHKHPENILKRTKDYWQLWVNKEQLNYNLLPKKLFRLYKRSLLIARTQIDNSGSIMAANDSDCLYFNRDTYSYMWPRDAALSAYALDLAGYSEISCNFFNLCAKIIEKDGYFSHKYTPSGKLASSWHPWQKDGVVQSPIQEDETALVIWALWNHFKLYKDIEFIKPLYKALIKNAADFMMNYRDTKTRLPLPSYDLWEERRGICTFTVAAVYGGLTAAANFAAAFGENEIADEYRLGAQEMRLAMDKYLYMEDKQRFCRMINFDKSGQMITDTTIDASLYGVFAFGAYEASDIKVKSTMQQIYDVLWCKTKFGGIARYQNDAYYRKDNNIPGNPWFVTTLWYAQYLISAATDKTTLNLALSTLEWVCDNAFTSGVLAEQFDSSTQEALSVSPLTWSHTAYIGAIQEYLNKLLLLEKCSACDQAKYSKKCSN